MRSLIQELARRGKAVLFSSHELETVERVCLACGDFEPRQGRSRRFHRAPAGAHGPAYTGRHLFPACRGAGYRADFARDCRSDLRMSATRPGESCNFECPWATFLFRITDLEALSAHALGDANKLLGQFATLLILVSVVVSFGAFGVGDPDTPPSARMALTLHMEHFLIATTMLVVGIFAVLTWDSTFPDRRDVLVLAPLPVRPWTVFLRQGGGNSHGAESCRASAALCDGPDLAVCVRGKGRRPCRFCAVVCSLLVHDGGCCGARLLRRASCPGFGGADSAAALVLARLRLFANGCVLFVRVRLLLRAAS